MRRLSVFLPLVIFVVMMGFFWRGLSNDPHHVPSPFIGKAVPKFSAKALHSGQTVDRQLFLGHVSLLNVFASWCLYCLGEHSVISEAARLPGLQVIGLNYKDERSAVNQWLADNGNPYALVIFDPKAEVAINFGVYGTPETYLIDSRGVIRHKVVGPLRLSQWETEIKPKLLRLLQQGSSHA